MGSGGSRPCDRRRHAHAAALGAPAALLLGIGIAEAWAAELTPAPPAVAVGLSLLQRDIADAALAQTQPGAPPAADLAAPPAAAAPLSAAPRFMFLDYRIEGASVLDDAAVRDTVAPYLGKPTSIADLEEIRRRLTLLYVNRGYVNSGFVIPDQDVAAGIVAFRAVEGSIPATDVTGTENFAPDYFSTRLEPGLKRPFNVNDLQMQQQILLQDPLVRRLNLELLPGLVPGEAKLHADVLEASPYALNFQIANNQSPTVGEVRGRVQGTVANLLGRGDILAIQYGRSQGLDDGTVSYTVPLASDDTKLSLRYDINGTVVVSPALVPLNITSRYDSVAIGLSRPFYRTPEATLTLGVGLDRRHAQTFLLGMPFSFTPGSDNGKTNVTALRFYQDWLDRDAEHAFALRSTFSVGVGALGATITGPPPDGHFFAWLGQGQYVRRVYRDWDLVVRSDLQLAQQALFPIEQFALGGLDTVRGYRQYLTVTDDAFFASGELRIPVATLRLPLIADSDDAGTIQLVPFYDFGRGWNVGRPTPYPAEISSVGAGLRWALGSGTTLELYYGKALRHVRAGTGLQDRGIHFRFAAVAF